MKSKEIKEYVEKGYLHVNVLFEVVGNPREHVEKALNLVLGTIKKEKGIVFVSDDTGSAEDAGEGLWGIYSEVELLLKDLNKLSWLAFNFIPASIELKSPAKLTVKDKDVTDFMGDMLSQLHQVNMKQVEIKSERDGLIRNINALIRNSVLLSCDVAGKPLKADEIGLKVGMKGKDVKPFLDAMIKEGKIVESSGKYSRKK